MAEVDHVLSINCNLGEGPIWNQDEQKLYWVDMFQNTIHTYQPERNAHQAIRFDDYVCALGFRRKGGMVLATRKHFAFWDGQSTELEYIQEIEANKPANRFNDGAVDRQGRFWVGTMHPSEANCSLYRLDTDLTVTEMEKGITISNGLGWSPDNTIMYVTDSVPHMIYAFDFDAPTGAISNRRPHIHTPELHGEPDGLTVDSEGFIWSARWGGFNVTRYAPDGTVDRVVDVPVEKVTSVTFGGANLTDLYITSASSGDTDSQRQQYPLAGDVFRLKVDVPGLPEPYFAG